MSRIRRRFVVYVCAVVIIPTLVATAQTGSKAVKRAKLPDFGANAGEGVFFNDVFSKLQGDRPSNLTVSPKPPASGGTSGTATANEATSSSGGAQGAWAAIISPTTIEDEVKSMKLVVDENVTTPAKFAGNDYKIARRTFSLLAMLFAIINEYDGEVRWKKDAPVARDNFAQTGFNAKVGTIQVYNEAKLRKQELQDLVGGGALAGKTTTPENDWSQIADRGPLMQRLESTMQTKLQPWTSNKGEFTNHAEDVFHEAEIVAAISEVLTKSGMEDADDSDYAAFAVTMKKAARDIVDAVKLNNHEQASSAVGVINKACSECHELYRSS